MVLFGWGKKSRDWEASNGSTVTATWSSFDIFWCPIGFNVKWHITDESGTRDATYDEVTRLFPYDPPKLSWFQRFGLVVAIVVLALIGWFYDSAYDKNERALDAYNSGDSATAIAEFEAATDQVSSDEDKTIILINLAYAYDAEGKTEEALATFQRALKYAKAGSGDHELIQGEIAYYSGDPAKAEEHYTNAYKIDPKDTTYIGALSFLYLDMDERYDAWYDPEKALRFAKEAYAIEPDEPIVLQNLGISYISVGDPQKGVEVLESIGPNMDPILYVYIALGYGEMGNDVKMFEAIEKAQAGGVDVGALFEGLDESQ